MTFDGAILLANFYPPKPSSKRDGTVFVSGRLGGYEDVNDANRLGRDPAMRWIVDGSCRGQHSCFHQPDGALRD